MRVITKYIKSEAVEREPLSDELRRNLASLCAVAESSVDGIVVADEGGRVLALNPAATHRFGYAPPEIVGQRLELLFAESSRERQRAAFERALSVRSRLPADGVLRLEGVGKDGASFPVTVSFSCWTARHLWVAVTVRSARAVTGPGTCRLSGLADAHVRDAIVVSTAGGSWGGPTILYANKAFQRMTGYSELDVLGRSFEVLAGPKTSRIVLRGVYHRLRRGSPAHAELIAYGRDGHQFLLEWDATPILSANGLERHVVSIQRDVTEERSVERVLRGADRDPLTGLPTRSVLERRIRRSIARSKERTDVRFALLFVDMDGFKGVNDQHGHLVGDRLLASAARRLQRTIRPGDSLARFGGDEFVVLLHLVRDVSDVTVVAERVQDCMSTPFEIQGQELKVAASIGVAMSHAGYSDPSEVIRDADTAMYRAKGMGRGEIQFFG